MISTRGARAGVFVHSMRFRVCLTLAVATVLLASFADVRAASAGDLDRVARFDIPAQSLDKALLEFGLQAHLQIMFAWKPAIDRLRSPIIKGRYSARQALSTLLKGTQLQYAARGRTITITPDPPESAATLTPAGDDTVAEPRIRQGRSKGSKAAREQRPALQEVTVTGTYIRGVAPVGSPLIVYSQEAIEESGAATIGEFARQIPENFSGADLLTSGLGGASQESVFNQAEGNVFGGSAFNLNGLGPAATLTLLNGQRLAPAGADGSFVDVSMIPLGAVDRIEILPDGASAIYGSDAVAGVVNIITKRDFQGAETDVHYGEATAGGAGEEGVSQLFGKSWSSGNLMLTYEYDGQSGLDASQRAFIPSQGGPYTVLPPNWLNSVLISGSQDIGSGTSIEGDALYSTKNYHSEFTIIPTGESEFYDNRDRAAESDVNITLHHAVSSGWSFDITGFYSGIQQMLTGIADFAFAGGFADDDTSVVRSDTSLAGANLLAQGAIFNLPGGSVRGAVGGSFEGQRYINDTSTTGTDNVAQPEEDLGRHETSAYGELDVPVIGPANALAGARKLELSMAARYDRYSDFGSSANPKLGLTWFPIEALDLRASYGTSYRAPLLSQLGSPVISTAELFPDPASPNGFTDTLYIAGGNPRLGPERARSFSVGPDLDVGGLSASATYSYTRYTDRVGTPPVASLLTVLVDPVDAPFVTRDPSLAVVEAAFNSPGFQGDYAGLGPAGVGAIFNSQFTNLAMTTQSSVDLRVSYRRETAIGVLTPSIAAVRQIRDELQASGSSPELELLDLYGEPLRWKIHGGLGWTRGDVEAEASLSYVSAYRDEFTTPPSPISSWTTADLHVSYHVPETVSPALLRGTTVALTVENITNERPPYVAIPLAVTGGAAPIPYDPANASPVGRIVSLQVNKRWAQ